MFWKKNDFANEHNRFSLLLSAPCYENQTSVRLLFESYLSKLNNMTLYDLEKRYLQVFVFCFTEFI